MEFAASAGGMKLSTRAAGQGMNQIYLDHAATTPPASEGIRSRRCSLPGNRKD